MAEIEKDEMCYLVAEGVIISGSTFFYFNFLYMVQQYKD